MFPDNLEVKATRLQAFRFPGVWDSQTSIQSAHEGGKAVSPKHRPPLPPRKYSWYSFPLSRPQAHSGTGRVMSMKNSSDTIGNRTGYLSACSSVPQPTAPTLWRCFKKYRNQNPKSKTTYLLKWQVDNRIFWSRKQWIHDTVIFDKNDKSSMRIGGLNFVK
jgi:hypothetical protein